MSLINISLLLDLYRLTAARRGQAVDRRDGEGDKKNAEKCIEKFLLGPEALKLKTDCFGSTCDADKCKLQTRTFSRHILGFNEKYKKSAASSPFALPDHQSPADSKRGTQLTYLWDVVDFCFTPTLKCQTDKCQIMIPINQITSKLGDEDKPAASGEQPDEKCQKTIDKFKADTETVLEGDALKSCVTGQLAIYANQLIDRCGGKSVKPDKPECYRDLGGDIIPSRCDEFKVPNFVKAVMATRQWVGGEGELFFDVKPNANREGICKQDNKSQCLDRNCIEKGLSIKIDPRPAMPEKEDFKKMCGATIEIKSFEYHVRSSK